MTFRNFGLSKEYDCRSGLKKQIARYRLMTGEKRLAVALDLHELSCDIAREGIRRQHPEADATEVERLLRHRLEMAYATSQNAVDPFMGDWQGSVSIGDQKQPVSVCMISLDKKAAP